MGSDEQAKPDSEHPVEIADNITCYKGVASATLFCLVIIKKLLFRLIIVSNCLILVKNNYLCIY